MAIDFLDFSKAFDMVSHQIRIEKLMKHGLNEQIERRIDSWLNRWAQRVLISDT